MDSQLIIKQALAITTDTEINEITLAEFDEREIAYLNKLIMLTIEHIKIVNALIL